MLFHDHAVVLENAVFGDDAAHAGSGIDIAVTAHDRAGIADAVAADLDVVAEHRTEFLDAGLDLLGAVVDDDEQIETGIKKFGAMLGDYVEVGCNSVCNPGTVIGRHSNIYPTSCVRGVVPENSIYKDNGVIVAKHE